MSYRWSWSRQFFPGEYFIEGEFGQTTPFICPNHKDDSGESICFKVGGSWLGTLNRYIGTWYMNTPLLVSDVMPGVNAKILKAYVKSMAVPGGWGSAWGDVSNKLLLLLADRTKLWESGELYIPEREWGLSSFDVNRLLNQSDKFMVSLFQTVTVTLGEWYGHVAEVRLDGEYYKGIAPPTASVRINVKDKQTGKAIPKSYVALMSGSVIVADGYTTGGQIIFENIEEGSYTIKISSDMYYDYDQSIEVISPSVWYIIKLAPIPTVPIPDWVWWVVGGAAALGVGVTAVSVIRRKREEKIVVLR